MEHAHEPEYETLIAVLHGEVSAINAACVEVKRRLEETNELLAPFVALRRKRHAAYMAHLRRKIERYAKHVKLAEPEYATQKGMESTWRIERDEIRSRRRVN